MSIVVSIIFVLIGVAVKYGKMYHLLAGYNTMSKERQALYDIEKIATLFKNVMFIMSIFILLGYAASIWLSEPKIEFFTVIVVVGIGILYLIIASNSKNFRRDG